MNQNKIAPPTGIETDPVVTTVTAVDPENKLVQTFTLPQHLRLTQVVLVDASDRHNELVHERQWLLHPSEMPLSLSGNLFLIEDLMQGSGKILIKCAPLPHARPVPSSCDLQVKRGEPMGFEFSLFEAGSMSKDSWTVLDYVGDRLQQTRILHDWQKAQRPMTAGHTLPRFLSNTWGDRSQDSRMKDGFIMAEIEAAQRLGVDVVQLDDGWQKGASAGSVHAKKLGGVWEGFWHVDPHFWTPHPERFPQGLRPLVDQATAKGIKIGLWFAPDSWNEFSNWRRDAACILALFTTLGVEHFKIDAVVATTELALHNLQAFFKTVLDGSDGKIVFDLDITAGVRPGYFGSMAVGPLFVENRYTDFHSYWPHQTLRNLWQLSRWVDPQRLRMEFLNNSRKVERYVDDPLAPAHYSPDTLFATVMLSNPLGWFEISNLPDPYIESVSKLVRTWKEHRKDLFSGTICPVGEKPDGVSYTGFISLSEANRYGYALIFRELHPDGQAVITVPGIGLADCTWEVLASQGNIVSDEDSLKVTIPKPLGFLFARFTRNR